MSGAEGSELNGLTLAHVAHGNGLNRPDVQFLPLDLLPSKSMHMAAAFVT